MGREARYEVQVQGCHASRGARPTHPEAARDDSLRAVGSFPEMTVAMHYERSSSPPAGRPPRSDWDGIQPSLETSSGPEKAACGLARGPRAGEPRGRAWAVTFVLATYAIAVNGTPSASGGPSPDSAEAIRSRLTMAIKQGDRNLIAAGLHAIERAGPPVAGEVLTQVARDQGTSQLPSREMDALVESICFHVPDPDFLARRCFMDSFHGLSVRIWLRIGLSNDSATLLRSVDESNGVVALAAASIALLQGGTVTRARLHAIELGLKLNASRLGRREALDPFPSMPDALASGLSQATAVAADAWEDLLRLRHYRYMHDFLRPIAMLAGRNADRPKHVLETLERLASDSGYELSTAEAVLAGLMAAGVPGQAIVLRLVERGVVTLEHLGLPLQMDGREGRRSFCGQLALVFMRRGLPWPALWVLRVGSAVGDDVEVVLRDASRSPDAELRAAAMEVAVGLLAEGSTLDVEALASKALHADAMSDEAVWAARALATHPTRRGQVRAWVRRRWDPAGERHFAALVDLASTVGGVVDASAIDELLIHPSEGVRASAATFLAKASGCRFVEWIVTSHEIRSASFPYDLKASGWVTECQARLHEHLETRAGGALTVPEILACAAAAHATGAARDFIVKLLLRAVKCAGGGDPEWRWSACAKCVDSINELGIYDEGVLRMLQSTIDGLPSRDYLPTERGMVQAWRGLHARAELGSPVRDSGRSR